MGGWHAPTGSREGAVQVPAATDSVCLIDDTVSGCSVNQNKHGHVSECKPKWDPRSNLVVPATPSVAADTCRRRRRRGYKLYMRVIHRFSLHHRLRLCRCMLLLPPWFHRILLPRLNLKLRLRRTLAVFAGQGDDRAKMDDDRGA